MALVTRISRRATNLAEDLDQLRKEELGAISVLQISTSLQTLKEAITTFEKPTKKLENTPKLTT